MHILHLHSSFAPGGKETRAVRLMNTLGEAHAHTVISGIAGAYGASAGLADHVAVALGDPAFPSLQGRPMPGRLKALARAMAGYDLILTYNFGAMDAVMAYTLFGPAFDLAPLVHHEDGFNDDEAGELKPLRNWYRRIGLGRASAVVVPSHRLEGIAREVWHQPAGRVRRIANGIDVAAYGKKARSDALPRVVKRPGELWLGTIAGLRAVKNLPRLVRAFAAMPEPWQLVICGEGEAREAIRDAALAAGVGHRVHLPGHVAEPAKVIGLFDLFALSSDSEQFPISVVEAMAAGLAVAAPGVGDIAAMVSAENAPFITPPGDEAALSSALVQLGGQAKLRADVGQANRRLARAEYDEARMLEAYRAVYNGALGRDEF